MTKFRLKIGPKGQIVIPKPIRDEYQIPPGTVLVLQDSAQGIYLYKPKVNLGELFDQLAKSGPRLKKVKIDSDADYDEMMAERMKDALR